MHQEQYAAISLLQQKSIKDFQHTLRTVLYHKRVEYTDKFKYCITSVAGAEWPVQLSMSAIDENVEWDCQDAE